MTDIRTNAIRCRVLAFGLFTMTAIVVSDARAGLDEAMTGQERSARVLDEHDVLDEAGESVATLALVQWPNPEIERRGNTFRIIQNYDPDGIPDEQRVLYERHPILFSVQGPAFGESQDPGETKYVGAIRWCVDDDVDWIAVGVSTAVTTLFQIEEFDVVAAPETGEWQLEERLDPRAIEAEYSIRVEQTRREPDRITSIRLSCPDTDDDALIRATLERADEDAAPIEVAVTEDQRRPRISTGEVDDKATEESP